MSTVQTEQVLVVPTQLFHDLGLFQGFQADHDAYLETLLDPVHTQYLPREQMESDPGYKQLIPYCLFQYLDDAGTRHVFRYTRGSGAGESRLRALKSVGVGGHISTLEAHEASPYDVGMQRELDEEIEIRTEFRQERVGMINDDSNEVGRVHLGIVHLFTVSRPEIHPREADIAEAGFEPVESVLADLEAYETWSRHCLEHLFGTPETAA